MLQTRRSSPADSAGPPASCKQKFYSATALNSTACNTYNWSRCSTAGIPVYTSHNMLRCTRTDPRSNTSRCILRCRRFRRPNNSKRHCSACCNSRWATLYNNLKNTSNNYRRNPGIVLNYNWYWCPEHTRILSKTPSRERWHSS